MLFVKSLGDGPAETIALLGDELPRVARLPEPTFSRAGRLAGAGGRNREAFEVGVPPTICCYSGVFSKGRMVAPPSPHRLLDGHLQGQTKEKSLHLPQTAQDTGHKHAQRHAHSTKTTFRFYMNQVSRSCPVEVGT